MVMNRKNKSHNPVVLRSGLSIGHSNAENDSEFLFDSFVDYFPVKQCMDTQSPKMILAGRTGAGKTAILRHIKQVEEKVFDLDPRELSITYISNSNAIAFVNAIGANLDLLFQILWRHILCIEYIKLRYGLADENKSILTILRQKFFGNSKKDRALQYLEEYSGQFHLTMDENVKTLTQKFENKLNAEFKIEIDKFSAGGQYDKRLSDEKKTELKRLYDKIVDVKQMQDLHAVISSLGENEKKNDKVHYYITIDHLDSQWADTSIRFKLIRALIDTLGKFRPIENLKILIALREDVIERVFQENNDISFQREKFDDYIIKIKWTKNQLRELIEKRIDTLFRKKYTQNKIVTFEEIFTTKIKNQSPFDYICERTLMRPRDVISFVNECLANIDVQKKISTEIIFKAEKSYSSKRKTALQQEWASALPTLPILLDFIANFRKSLILVSELCDKNQYEDLLLKLCEAKTTEHDPICLTAKKALNSENGEPLKFIQEIIISLYRIGIIGIKINSESTFIYSHLDQVLINNTEILLETKIRIHPILHAALHLNENRDSKE